jgi:hypothetical protein
MSANRRFGWQRLADVDVPWGIEWWLIAFGLLRQRNSRKAIDQAVKNLSEVATYLGTRMREGDDREMRLIALQESVERQTRWLVRLTLVLGLIGLASIGATLWSALR